MATTTKKTTAKKAATKQKTVTKTAAKKAASPKAAAPKAAAPRAAAPKAKAGKAKKPTPSLQEKQMMVAVHAYHKWESAGCPGGQDFQHWIEAEAEVEAMLK